MKHLLKTTFAIALCMMTAAGISTAVSAAQIPASCQLPIVCQNGSCSPEQLQQLLNQCCGGICIVNNDCADGNCSTDDCSDGSCVDRISLDNTSLQNLLGQLGIGTGDLPGNITVTPTVPDTQTETPSQPVTVPDTPTETPVITPTETPNNTASDISAYEQQVIDLVNDIRVQNGLSPLKANSTLSKCARAKSQDMHDKHYFSHTSPTYGSPFDMMRQFGISYRSAGENIAMGQQTPQAVVNAWMNSEGHRANILNSSFTEIGVGYVADGHYWTQQFIG